MYKGKKVSVVMPAYNEEEAIVQVVKDFKRDFVDEVIVCDNDSIDNTAILAEKAGAKVVKEIKKGQGYAVRKALAEASGDLIFLTESDATFLAKDMERLLVYLDDADAVVGSRVHKPLLGHKAINWWTIWGNFFLSMFLQVWYGNKSTLEDVGVSFKLFKKEALKKILPEMKVGGSDSNPEHFLLLLKHGFKVIQIPTCYMSRKGVTKQSFNIWSSFKIGVKHFWVIFYRKF